MEYVLHLVMEYIYCTVVDVNCECMSYVRLHRNLNIQLPNHIIRRIICIGTLKSKSELVLRSAGKKLDLFPRLHHPLHKIHHTGFKTMLSRISIPVRTKLVLSVAARSFFEAPSITVSAVGTGQDLRLYLRQCTPPSMKSNP